VSRDFEKIPEGHVPAPMPPISRSMNAVGRGFIFLFKQFEIVLLATVKNDKKYQPY